MPNTHYLQEELYQLVKQDATIFNFIQAASLDGLWYLNVENGEDEWMNEKFWQTLGYNPTEMPHNVSAWKSIIFQEDLEAIRINLVQHLENPSIPFEQTVRYKHKNNHTVWIQCRGIAIVNKSGIPTRMLGAHINVTNIKQNEETLKEVNNKLKNCIANMGDLVFIVNNELIFKEYYAESAQDDLYLEPEKIIGKHLEELHFPENLTKQFTAAITLTLETGIKQIVDYELQIQNSLKYFQLSIIPTTKNQPNTEVICVIDNVSALKKSEKEKVLLSNLVNNASDAIITKGKNNIITNWNKGAENLYGFSKEEAIGKNLYSLVNCNFSTSEFEEKTNTLLKDNFWNAEMVHYHKNGKPIHVEVSTTAVTINNNEIEDCITVIKNIDKQKIQQATMLSNNSNLSSLLKDKTTEIDSLLEKINDGFVTLDHQLRYTYINKKGCELLKKNPTDLIGKNIWEVFPDAVNTSAYFAIEKALKTQQSVTEIDHYKPLNAWFENHIYPTETGISIFIKDITESKQAFENTLQSERNLKAIFNSTSEGFLLIDAQTFMVKAFNEKAKHIAFLNSKNEVEVGKHIYNFITPDRIETIKVVLSKVVGGESISYDKSYQQPNGSIKWIHFSIVPVFDAEFLHSICVTGTDITDRKIAEEKTKINEQRFRKLIENSTDGFMLISATDEVIEISDRGIAILEMPESEIIGSKNFCFTKEKDYQFIKEIFDYVKENPTEIKQIECNISKNGEKWIEAVFNNQLAEPSINAIVVNFRDITNRKKNEEALTKFNERFILLSKATNDAVWDWNLITNEIWWSEAHYTLFGFNPNQPIPSQEAFMQKIHPDDVKKLYEGFEKIKTEKISGWDGETRFFKPDGSIGIAYQRCFVLYNNENEPVRLLGSFMDITKTKRAEEKIRKSNELLIKLTNNLKGAIYQINTQPNGIANFEFISKGIEKLFPNFTIEEIEKQLLNFSYVLNDDKQKVVDSLEHATTELLDWEYEYRVNINNELKWLRAISHPEKDVDGTITWYGNIEDVTERRNHLVAIENQNKQLREIAWMQSHVVRAPLARIMGIIQYLEKDTNWLQENQRKKEILEQIIISANELDNIIRKIIKHTESIDNLDILEAETNTKF